MTKQTTKLRTEHFLLILVIAAFMSALWRYILGVPPFEEFWWAHLAPVGVVRPHSYDLGITAASCVTWAILAPFLYRAKGWSVVPVAVMSPFLWAVLVSLGLLLAAGFGRFGFSAALGGLFMRGLAAFLGWVFSLQPARVIFPIAGLTSLLVWLSLNKFDPAAWLD